MLSPPSSPPKKKKEGDVDVDSDQEFESMTNAAQSLTIGDPSWEAHAGGLTMLPTSILSAPHSSSLAEIGGEFVNLTAVSRC